MATEKMHHREPRTSSKITERLLPRKAVMDLERGVAAARNVQESELGRALLRRLTHDDYALTSTLNHLRVQSARTKAHYEQERRIFLHRIEVRPDPTIILARPPSPGFLIDQEVRGPSYMRSTIAKPTRRRVNFCTIDAYSVETPRKMNPWQTCADTSHRNPRFHCIVKPSVPLDHFEKRDLMRGFARHQRIASLTKMPDKWSAKTGGARKATNPKRRLAVKKRAQAFAKAEEKQLEEEAEEKEEKLQPRIFVTDSSYKTPEGSKSVSFVKRPTGLCRSLESAVSERRAPSVIKEEASDTDGRNHKPIESARTDSIKPGRQSATQGEPTRPKSARVKHKKVKRKQERQIYRRSGLKLVSS